MFQEINLTKHYLDAAIKAGAKVVARRVELTKADEGKVKLDENSLQEAIDYWDGNEPDLIVDSGGCSVKTTCAQCKTSNRCFTL